MAYQKKQANQPMKESYVESLIEQRDKRLKDVYLRAREYLEKEKFLEKTVEQKTEYLLSKNGLIVLEHLSAKRLPIVEISELLGFTQTFFHNLMRDNPELYDAIDRGRAKDLDDVESALYRIAKGYTAKGSKTKVFYNARSDAENRQTEEFESEVAPNFLAISYLLKNKRSLEYKDKQIEYELAKNTINVQIELIGDETLNLD